MYNYDNNLLNDYFRNATPSIMNQSQNLYTPEEGYNKGNLFIDLYDEYKNYKPAILQAKNEKDALYLELSRYAFAAHELNLYLDLHPEDTTMLTLFNDYRVRANKLMMDYEAKYGPLTISSDSMENSFTWQEDKWPWEGGSN